MPKGIPTSGVNKGWFKKGHGRKHTEEEKKKIGNANRKALTGKKLSLEHRQNISKAVRGKNNSKNNGNYIHGNARKKYIGGWNKLLRESIRQRDNYTCQECNKSQKENGRKLCVHHIDYDKNNHKPLNLISLCGACHAKTTIKDKLEYFKNKYSKSVSIRFNDYNQKSHVD